MSQYQRACGRKLRNIVLMMSFLRKLYLRTENKISTPEKFLLICLAYLSIIQLSNTQPRLFLAMTKNLSGNLFTQILVNSFLDTRLMGNKVLIEVKSLEKADTFTLSQVITKM